MSTFRLIAGRGGVFDVAGWCLGCFDDNDEASGSVEPMLIYVGFDSQWKVEYLDASPNIARGNGC